MRSTRALALAFAALAAVACGDNSSPPADPDAQGPDAPPPIDAGIDAPVDAATFTTFVIDQIVNHTDSTGAPVPASVYGALADPDVNNPAAYDSLFP